ncbi:MAG TPA: hypothetical protein PKC73_09580 [Dermatophilaceae bacterium]|jgi:hypothetical protein|nr:hypothetical protein [Actinomycetales bacterium]HMT31115.1 hypothetical protein [Dermatophilaceae bacterium]HMT89876.1 hypothetical protein [Dermatophilaceae bacterium]
MTTRRSAWRLVGTALVMSGALALSGCSGATRPGTALVVDGTTYSQAQVSEATRQLNTMAELAAQPLSDKTTVNWLVVAPFVLAHSDAKGLWTPDAGYNAMMAQIASPTAETVSIVKANNAAATFTDADWQDVLAKIDHAQVIIDPRYGSGVNPKDGTLLKTTPDWIIQPAASTKAP